jgi:Asp-tRNA(Asn)/Glu-tRNA(Gln) amidotransferase A subunit family amidase
MSKQPYQLTATEAVTAIGNGTLTVRELIDDCWQRIEQLEGEVGAWIHLDREVVDQQVDALEKKMASGKKGILFGIPVGIKDIFNTEKMPTCMGSPIWEGFTPGNNARAVESLVWQDAVIMGKTVTAEFAVHHPGKTVNPHDYRHYPGTSSSGSAAAVATGMVPAAIGTQTAGSTIRPASYCGIYGFKPSFGTIPRTGVLKTLDTLDHVTVMSRCIDDLKLLFDSMRVKGRNYPYVHRHLDPEEAGGKKRNWRVGFVRTPVWEEAADYVQEAMRTFAGRLGGEAGISVEEVSLPDSFSQVHAIHDLIYSKALSYYFKDEYREYGEQISDVMKTLIEKGRAISHAKYLESLELQNHYADELDHFFDDFDILLSHSTASEAPEGLICEERPDPCLIWTLCRVPSINLPIASAPNGLPFGCQVIAKRYNDYSLLAFCRQLQQQGLVREAPYPALQP